MHVSLAIKDACSLQVKGRACLPLLEPLLRGHWQLMPWLQRHIDIIVLLSGPEQLCLCHLPVHETRKSHSAIWDGPWWTHWVSCSQAGSHKASCLPLHAGSFAPSVPNDKWEVLPFFFQAPPWHMPETTVTRRFIWAHHQQHWQSSAGEEGWCTWNTRHCLLWWWDTSADTCHGSGVRDGSHGLPAITWCPSALLIWQGAQVHSRLEVGIATCKWQLRPDHIDDQLCLVPQLQAFQEWCMVWRKEVCFEFFPGKWNKCPWAGFMVQFLACHGGVLVSLLSQPGLLLLYFVTGISCSRIRTSSGSTCPRSFKTLVFQRMPVLSWYGRNSHCDWPLGESKSWRWSNLDGSAGMMLPVSNSRSFGVQEWYSNGTVGVPTQMQLVNNSIRWEKTLEAWSLLSSAFPRKPLKMHMWCTSAVNHAGGGTLGTWNMWRLPRTTWGISFTCQGPSLGNLSGTCESWPSYWALVAGPSSTSWWFLFWTRMEWPRKSSPLSHSFWVVDVPLCPGTQAHHIAM